MPSTSKCETPYCRGEPKGGRSHCTKCRARKWRKENPYKYHYTNLKNRARQRGKGFNLCLEQFMLIWLCEPEKWKDKLAQDECRWQMDRINEDGIYEFDNIQILTKRKNIHKYIDHRNKMKVTAHWTEVKPSNLEKAPF